MVKSYLRYAPHSTLGVIYSPGSNLQYDNSGKLGLCPTLDSISIWNLRQGTLVSKLEDSDNGAEVTCLSLQSMPRSIHDDKGQNGSCGNVLAVGYADGSIRLWNLEKASMGSTSSLMVTLRGHSAGVVSLAWESGNGGTRLASGSRDGDLVVWDVPGEVGLCRLRGHKESITGLCFLNHNPSATGSSYLVSSSKDSTLRVWDLQLKHCVETSTEHAAEISGLALHPSLPLLVTGSLDSPTSLRLFKLNLKALSNLSLHLLNHTTSERTSLEPVISYCGGGGGNLERKSGKEKPSQIQFHPSGKYLAVSGFEKTIDIFKVLDEEEKKKLLARRHKRAKEKAKLKEEESMDSVDPFLGPTDEFKHVTTIRLKYKLRSFSWSNSSGGVSLLVGNFHNQVVNYELPVSGVEFIEKHVVDGPGHRTEVKGVQFSHSGDMLATFSSVDGLVKIWNVRSGASIRTIVFETLNPLQALMFVPGDKHLVIAGSNGVLALVEIASGESVFSHVSAHTGAVRSIVGLPDGSGFVSGGADKLVHFWDYDEEKTQDSSRLVFQRIKSLELPDEVVALRVSPNGTLLTVSLLDFTIRVFYTDTLKFFLSLYGHKLPALALDVAGDSQTLVSVSADKSIKVWGLDFGDCRKSLFGHSEAILTVAFIPKTHLAFTAGKDGFIKYWDLDKAVGSNGPICKLSRKPFASQVSALAVSPNGTLLVAISADRAIRVFLRTNEHVFAEEEREKELEDLLDASILSEDPRNKLVEDEESQGNSEDFTTVHTKTSTTSLTTSERLFELIEAITEETHLVKESGKPIVVSLGRHPVLLALAKGNSDVSAEFLLLEWMERVPTFELEQSLLLLPFSAIQSLFLIVETWFIRGWNPILSARVVVFLVRLHGDASSSSKSVRLALDRIAKLGAPALSALKHMYAFNKAVLELAAIEWHALHSITPLFLSEPTTSSRQTTTTTTKSGSTKRKKSIVTRII